MVSRRKVRAQALRGRAVGWGLRSVASAICSSTWAGLALAQSVPPVVTDGSLGPTPVPFDVPSADGVYVVTEDLGERRGANLFHSFSRLDVPAGEAVVFDGAPDVRHVLARVTGGAPSAIDGTLAVAIDGANLYLINPAGVVFGPTAALDLTGSFYVTTADYVALADGGRFSAAAGPADTVLSVAPPAAFGFLRPSQGAVRVAGAAEPDVDGEPPPRAVLSVAPGASLTAVGGAVDVDNALLEAPGGRVNVIATAAAGEVAFDGDDPAAPPAGPPGAGVANGPVRIVNNSIVDASELDADLAPVGTSGSVLIRGGRIEIAGASQVLALTVDGDGGGITVDADELDVAGGALVTTGTFGAGRGGDLALAGRVSVSFATGAAAEAFSSGDGDGGDLVVTAGSLVLDGAEADVNTTGLFTSANAGGAGGDLRADVDTLRVFETALLSAATGGPGAGGVVRVTAADGVLLDGRQSVDRTGLAADATFDPASGFDGTGPAGGIELTAGAVEIRSAAGLGSNSIFDGAGPAGFVRVRAASLLIDAAGSQAGTGISTISGALFEDEDGVEQQAGGGPGGPIDVGVTGLLRVVDGGASIRANTFGAERAGDVTVRAGRIEIDRLDSPENAGIGAQVEATAAGAGGVVDVEAGSILITGGGRISATTGGPGDAGRVRVASPDLRLDGGGSIDSESEADATGRGGDVRVEAGTLVLAGGARVAASTFGSGDAGNVDVVTTGDVGLAGASLIANATFGTGAAGDILIDAGAANLSVASRSLVTASTAFGGGAGGDVTVRAGNVLVADGQIAARTFGDAPGGKVTVDAASVALARVEVADEFVPGITAESGFGAGRGGDVVLRTGALSVLNGARVGVNTQGAGGAGTLAVAAGQITLDGQGNPSFRTGLAANTTGAGEGGRVTVVADRLDARAGGEIAAVTSGPGGGAGGVITLDVDDVALDGLGFGGFTGVGAETTGAGNTGAGGDIVIRGDALDVRGGASVSAASTAGSAGRAGSVDVSVRVLTVDRAGASRRTALSANTEGGGPGGDLVVRAGERVEILNGGELSAVTTGSGIGGGITVVTPGELVLDGTGTDAFTGIGAETQATGDPGPGGSVTVNAGTLRMTGGARVSTAATAGGTGDAGGISVTLTGEAVVAGGASLAATAPLGTGNDVRLTAAGPVTLDGGSITAAAGTAGSVTLTSATGDVRLLNGAAVSVRAGIADAGSISINAPRGSIVMSDDRGVGSPADAVRRSLADPSFEPGNTRVTAEAPRGAAGQIKLTAADSVSFSDSLVTAQARALASGSAAGDSAISVDPDFVLLDNSVLNGRILSPADSAAPAGTDVPVFVDQGATFIQSTDSAILSNNTSVPVEVDIAGSLVRLPGGLSEGSAALQDQCAALLRTPFSTFVVTGRGGSPPAPGGWTPDVRPASSPDVRRR